MNSQRSFGGVVVLSLLTLSAVAWISLELGPSSANMDYVLYQVRLPRFCLAALLGACLGVAGTLLQLATKNPLSEPELLGINQTAVLAVVSATLIFGKGLSSALMIGAALLGGSLAGLAVLLMATSGSFPRDRLILAGLTIAFFSGSTSSGMLLLRDTDLFELLYWISGKLSGSDWSDVKIASVALCFCLALSLLRCHSWNLLQIGDDNAQNLGVNPVARRIEMLVLTVILCSISVALAGPIGFVGIVIPHVSELLVGLDYRKRLPVGVLLGAILVSSSDLIARTLLAPSELPVGVLTAFVGAPYFLYQARRL